MNKVFALLYFFLSILLLCSCEPKTSSSGQDSTEKKPKVKPRNIKYGLDINQYTVVKRKIKRGETFGSILEDSGIDYPEVYKILQAIKNKLDVRRLVAGKSFSFFYTKDSISTPKAFVYEPQLDSYSIVFLRDSIYGKKVSKPIEIVQKEGNGLIENSLYETMKSSGLNDQLTYYLADVYAWNIDFYRLQKGDRFKVIYTEKFVDDSISIGIERIKAAYFEHKGKPLYAFEYISDEEKGIVDYFDDEAKSLRRAFLQGPLKFNRVSSRYNLRRRIAYYGNRIRPHKGTDFAASVGTPILATANGTITKASYTRGNGNYVMIKHNGTYSTQYLHMKKRNVKVGQFVEQGDVIGWVGMTGNTSGPHVCYRFWKNGRQVDPFKQKLPDAKPIAPELKSKFARHIVPYKTKLDCIAFETQTDSEIAVIHNQNQNAKKDPS